MVCFRAIVVHRPREAALGLQEKRELAHHHIVTDGLNDRVAR